MLFYSLQSVNENKYGAVSFSTYHARINPNIDTVHLRIPQQWHVGLFPTMIWCHYLYPNMILCNYVTPTMVSVVSPSKDKLRN